jgi:S1-C subfamily serine protease
MTLVDWVIAAIVFALALWGFGRGLIVGVLGLGGLVIGGVLGSRLGPMLVEGGSASPYAPMFTLLGALTIGALTLTVAIGLAEGIRRTLVRGYVSRVIDGIGGALLAAALALALVWIASAAILFSTGSNDLRRAFQRSSLLTTINETFPPSGPLIKALYRLDPFPSVATSPGDVDAPDRGAGQSPGIRTAALSVVKVSGVSCGIGVMGSGWVIAPGVVVTNAHVVAGQTDTLVQTPEGQTVGAVAVAFNPRNDIAILSAPIDSNPLGTRDGSTLNLSGAVIGYPNDGPLRLSPARAGESRKVLTRDAYGRGPIERRTVSLRGRVRRGNSGGPLVDRGGRVIGTVFAATTKGPPGGLAVPNAVVRRIAARASGQVSTGPCAK